MATPAKLVALPVLSKSRQKDLACESLYVAKHISQSEEMPSAAAARGTEIHEAISSYVQHLVKTYQRTDYDFMRTVAQSVSPEAKEIIEGFIENFVFEPERVLFVERRLALDQHFQPVPPQSADAEYAGTLDLVTMTSEDEARIDDWKSQFAIADAESFEAKFYALLMFCINPGLERVTFVLNFVRYGSACRTAEFKRSDVPTLKQIAEKQRERQRELHERISSGEEATAAPGRHCVWCPLLLESCPLAKVNPYAKLTPERRLMQAVWLKKALASTTEILRDHVIESGPIECRDDNGGLLRAEFRPKLIHSYPLTTTNKIIAQWNEEHGDGEFVSKLTVGGLSSPLKAKKRAELAAQLGNICQERAQTDFKIGTSEDEE